MSQRPILLQYFRRNSPMGPPTCFDGGECIESLSLACARALSLSFSLSLSLSLSHTHTHTCMCLYFSVLSCFCGVKGLGFVSCEHVTTAWSVLPEFTEQVSLSGCVVCVCVCFSLSMNVHYFRCFVCYVCVFASVLHSVPECFYIFV